MPPGRFTATNIPLKVLITNAYQLSFFQVVGGPDWVSTDRFDIAAKAPDGAPPEQTRAMVRTLLKDRFKLVVHMETRDTPIYALVESACRRSTWTEAHPIDDGLRADPRAARRRHGCGSCERGEWPRSLFAQRPRRTKSLSVQMRLSGRGGATLAFEARQHHHDGSGKLTPALCGS